MFLLRQLGVPDYAPPKGPDADWLVQEYINQLRCAKISQVAAWCGTGVIVLQLIVTLAFYSVSNKPPGVETYFSLGANNTIRVEPAVNPAISYMQVLDFSKRAVADLMSLHFGKLVEQLKRRKHYFAGDGFQLYARGLGVGASSDENTVVSRLMSEGLIVTSVVPKKPHIRGKYERDGRTHWVVDLLALQTVQGAADSTKTTRRTVMLVVVEVPRTVARRGLQIVSLDYQ